MIVKELKKILENVPDHMDIFIKQTNHEFPNSLAQSGEIKKIAFSESEGGPVLAKDNAFIITDEFTG